MNNYSLKHVWLAALTSVFITAGAAAVPFTLAETATYNGSASNSMSGASMPASAGAVPATVADLGALNGDSGAIVGTHVANVIQWYSFMADGFTYLDITTNGSAFDTEIGLYDAAGNRVGNDDDDGLGLDSTLSFGAGSGMALGDPFNLGGDGIANGEDGALAAGLYYLAIGEFNTTFNATGFSVVTDGFDSGGDYTINIFTDARPVAAIPEPAALLLLGLGLVGIGFARRRL